MPDLLIAGASGRAAAFSAVRAGLRVSVADLFADYDLAAVADVAAIADWPDGIAAWADRFPTSVPLMFTGGLENHPHLLRRIVASRPLAGAHGKPLTVVRTPESLCDLLTDAGAAVPVARSDPPDGGRWLVKPRNGGGGRGVRFWREGQTPPAEFVYFQEFVPGVACSAAYLAHPDNVELLGLTEQLSPTRSPLAEEAPFAYAGSVTTDCVADESLSRIGRAIANCGIRGLFGVDLVAVEAADGTRFFPVEVNPRYTAGMEVLELRNGQSFVAEHFACFDGRRPEPHRVAEPIRSHVGKRVVYADRSVRAGTLEIPSRADVLSGRYEIADIPAPGTPIAAGTPICTLLATAATSAECRRLLELREEELLNACEPWTTETATDDARPPR